MPTLPVDSVEENIFITISLCASVVAALFLSMAFILGYDFPLKVIAAVSLGFYGAVAALSYFKGWYSRLVIPFKIYTSLIVLSLFFYSGGFYSDTPVFMIAALLVFVMVAPGAEKRKAALIIYLVVLAALVVIQFTMPELVEYATTPERRTRGNAVTTVIVSLGVGYAVYVFKTRYDTDRRRLATLMGELNHRVKNNLGLVSSLIRLKDTELGGAADLSDIQQQVSSVALIHEKLQETPGLSSFALRPYLEDLVATVFSSAIDGSIEVRTAIDDIVVETSRAVTLGLIVTEVATNTIKYGVSGEETTIFSLTLHEENNGGGCILTVGNSGNPMPEDVTLDNPGSLGLRLISSLVEQLEGTIELTRTPSPKYEIIFPLHRGAMTRAQASRRRHGDGGA